jgi:hypothetical protein
MTCTAKAESPMITNSVKASVGSKQHKSDRQMTDAEHQDEIGDR